MQPTRPHTRHYRSLEGLPTITELFCAAARSGDRTYVVDGDQTFSYRQIKAHASHLQGQLEEAGVGRDDIVTVQMPNWWQTIAVAHAVWAMGGIVNPATTIYRSGDLATILGLSRPRALVVPTEFRGVDHLKVAVEALRLADHQAPVIAIDHMHTPAVDTDADLEVADVGPDEVAMLMYTSGTTGLPKGVLHTHRTLLAESASIAETFDLHGSRVFMPSPLTHITGLLYGVLMPIQIDEGVALLDRWDPDKAFDIIEQTGCRVTVAATPFLSGLADACEERGSTSSIDLFVCGGADIPDHLVKRAEIALGAQVSRTYGSTELPTLCTIPPEECSDARYTTEGPPIGEAEARLSNVQDGVGELEVHGPELFVGYLDNADNEHSFTPDGWFRTGDLATIDTEGRIAIVGRTKDLIIRGGENISAKEVEDLLTEMAGIRECAVVGIPHPVLGETVCAVAVPHQDAEVTLGSITAHLATADIAKQKYPEALLITGELPRTTSGKIQKFLVRRFAAVEVEAGRADTRLNPRIRK